MDKKREKEIVMRNIMQIATMDRTSVEARRQAISAAKISAKARDFLYRSCDERINELNAICNMVVEHGELDDMRDGISS